MFSEFSACFMLFLLFLGGGKSTCLFLFRFNLKAKIFIRIDFAAFFLQINEMPPKYEE